MPLRDHFHPPLSTRRSWDALHGGWPMMLATDLNRRLPSAYVASPQVHLGSDFEIDVAAVTDRTTLSPLAGQDSGGGTAIATWAPSKPTLTVETDLPEQDAYEVRVVELEGQRLVAAIEIVSPANKDRPENRRAFVTKCVALLQQGVSIAIIDLVTTRKTNLYRDLLSEIGQTDTPPSPAASLYAVACRCFRDSTSKHSLRFESWENTLALGQALPTLPLWLAPDFAVALDLETTYEQTCQALRMP